MTTMPPHRFPWSTVSRMFAPVAVLFAMSWSACAGGATAQPSGSPPPPERSSPSGSGGLQPGEYMTERGWGRLLIQSEKGEVTFSLESTTGDSLCTLDGTIDGDQGIARQDGGRSSCVVGFGHSAQGIDVKAATLAECRDFCGFNGSFAGRYVRVKEGCGRDEVDRTRATFQRLYDRRNFKAALAILSPVLENCSVTLDWEDEGAIRNDLAITQYSNGLHAQCLATLARYAGDAAKDDDAAADGWAPALAERYLDIVRAARTNIGLCRKGAQKRAP
ncbi:hypothetical protein [Paracidovorax avenae]|uniref:hypothetical protein n=1 Tax=Paracidovorax avenae TaxID=80867 RepID=UPI001CEF7675|nr:hypothetical protein [Paracidovorax avenae]